MGPYHTIALPCMLPCIYCYFHLLIYTQKKKWKKKKFLDTTYEYVLNFQSEINVPPKYLLEELYFGVGDLPKWNRTVKESHKVQTIDEYTDITYQVSEEGAGGLVSSRDFVNLRHWAHIENTYVIACVKCEHPKLPPSKFVRWVHAFCKYYFIIVWFPVIIEN